MKIEYSVRSRWNSDIGKALGDGDDEINIVSVAEGGGCNWEFAVEEYDYSGYPYIRVCVYNTALQVLHEFGEFFYHLRKDGLETLEGVEDLLRGKFGATEFVSEFYTGKEV